MANYQIQATQIEADKVIFVHGKVHFSSIARLIEGAALDATNRTRAQHNMSPMKSPFTQLTISEPEVAFADPANPTKEELFIAERVYTPKADPNAVHFNAQNTTGNIPIVAKRVEGSDKVTQVILEDELAQGVPVTMVLRTYKPRNYNNHGVSLDQVVINDTEVRYRGVSSVTQQAMAARGLVFDAPVVPPTQPNDEPAEDSASVGPQPGSAQPPAPAQPAAQPASVAPSQPFTEQNAPAPQAAQSAPVAAPAPAAPAVVGLQPPAADQQPAMTAEQAAAEIARLQALVQGSDTQQAFGAQQTDNNSPWA